MKRTYKNLLLLLILAGAMLLPISAQIFFTGDMGLGATMSPKNSGSGPAFTTHGFLSGQVEFSPDLMLRLGLSSITSDIGSVLSDNSASSELFVDTVNLSYHIATHSNVHNYITLFFNEEDAIGSASFLKKYLAVDSEPSHLTRTLQGTNAVGFYPMDGFGISYAAILPSSKAFGLYAYMNNENDTLNFKTDFRVAASWEMFAFDLVFGGDVNTDAEPTEDNLVLTVSDFSLRSGLAMIIGKTHSTHVATQIGFLPGVIFPADKPVISLDNLFFLIEPRIKIANSYLHFSAFLFPEEVLETLFYVSKPLGLGISYINNGLFNHPVSGGLHIVSSTDVDTVTNNLGLSKDTISLNITPFVTFKTTNGDISVLLKINPINTKNSLDSSRLSLEYKVQI